MTAKTRGKILAALGKTIRRNREATGVSQEDFAEKVGVHRTYIGSVERGERNVSIVNLVRIAYGLGLDASKLIRAAEEEIREGD